MPHTIVHDLRGSCPAALPALVASSDPKPLASRETMIGTVSNEETFHNSESIYGSMSSLVCVLATVPIPA